MAQAQEEENHWPGFVDALSTIVMVVTFLLIILAIAIFVMSLKIAEGSAQEQSKSDAAETSSNVEEAESVVVQDDPVEVPSDATAVKTIDSDERFMLQFSGLTIQVDDSAKERVRAFATRTGERRPDRKLQVVSYFDTSLSYTKAQRVAYYRLLSVRSTLSDSGIDPDDVTIFVKEAPTLDRIDTVEISIE